MKQSEQHTTPAAAGPGAPRSPADIRAFERKMSDLFKYVACAAYLEDPEPDHDCTPGEVFDMVDFMRRAEEQYGAEALVIHDDHHEAFLTGMWFALRWALGQEPPAAVGLCDEQEGRP